MEEFLKKNKKDFMKKKFKCENIWKKYHWTPEEISRGILRPFLRFFLGNT